MTPRKKLIEVALPLDAINREAAKEKSVPRRGHPQTIHLWWARRPLAACRAVLFGQLVDDPSSWPDRFPTEAEQDAERQRLFRIIEELVKWERSNDETVVNAARLEIARSIARGRRADEEGDARDDAVLAEGVQPLIVNSYLAEVAPPVHDPFAGGGSIPLEAQRLGLRAIASDLNPVAVLINKALIEIPPRFAGRPPVNPESRRTAALKTWRGAQGLAEDVRYYGAWIREEARKRIGHLYPPVEITEELAKGRPDLEPYVGKKLTVIAWLWARTVASPNPASKGAHVPLVSSFWLSKKKGREAWVEPLVDRRSASWRFTVRTSPPADPDSVGRGTKSGRGDFRCLLTDEPIPVAHIRQEARNGRLGSRLMAMFAETRGAKLVLPPVDDAEAAARVPVPEAAPDTALPESALGFRVQGYGMLRHRDLFSPRQLTALVSLCQLVRETKVEASLSRVGDMSYNDVVRIYLALGLGRTVDYNSTICTWNVIGGSIRSTFARHALQMTWDYYETNPLAETTGSWSSSLSWVVDVLSELTGDAPTIVEVADASARTLPPAHVIATDPPYYDNIGYADLSDLFYVWLRQVLREVDWKLFSTVLVPKSAELIASPHRFGGNRAQARDFFEAGLRSAFSAAHGAQLDAYPMSVFYAFKQAESDSDDGHEMGQPTASTGWETLLHGLIGSGFTIVGTWPMRTERSGRTRDLSSNALASSIVLVCRKRPADAPSITRSDFRRLLRSELPPALKALQKGNIAPVDMAQASIGPGMAIYSRHAKVIEADGSTMGVRTALQIINQALDEYLAEREGEFDSDTRFAVTWFESHCFDAGAFGDAETLAKARNVSVQGVKDAGVLHSAAGKVRLLARAELPDDWDPAKDTRLTIWEATQHLIKRLENRGEEAASELMVALGGKADAARDLAYRLYATCERKGWAEEARAYNGLVVSWPQIAKLASQKRGLGPAQGTLFDT